MIKSFGIHIKLAIQFVQDNLSDCGKIFVAFSGGKDSICTAKIMELSGLDYQLYYSFTGLDPPEVVRFIRKNYPKCIFLKPKKTFWQSFYTNCCPSARLRWCCTTLKKEPSWHLPHKKRVFGIRKEESSRRSGYGLINYFEKLDHTHYYPIYYWKEWLVWEFIEKYKLKYPKLYDQGFNRLGCIICPYHSTSNGKLHGLYRKRWPKYFIQFEKAVEQLYQKRVSQGKEMFYPTPEEFINAWYLNSMARWYKPKE